PDKRLLRFARRSLLCVSQSDVLGIGKSVPVGCFGGFFDLVVRLLEQFLGLCSVAVHVKFICALRSRNLRIGLVDQALCCSEVGVAAPTHILSSEETAGHEPEAQNGAEDNVACFHRKTLRSKNTDACSGTQPKNRAIFGSGAVTEVIGGVCINKL